MATLTDYHRTLPGAHCVENAVNFRVWAPEREVVRLVLVEPNGRQRREIEVPRAADGFHCIQLDDVRNGDLYFYKLDDDAKLYPDPATHFQPQGVHGPSQVVDHRRFRWTDSDWRGCRIEGQVIYELHIGTFTPEGTWAAAATKFEHLRDLGITTIEVMPINSFAGDFGWGYDGVCWYAPTELYGTPEDFRAFVNTAHRFGLGVILDVVYNHFGPDGNYTGVYSPYYVSRKHHTEWGAGINFDGKHSGPVREFFTENASYWIREFHLDGLRLDATHSIVDDSTEHVVAEITRKARAAAAASGRSIIVVSEDADQQVRQILPSDKGGYGVDGLWNDDFHHACRVAATGNTDGYYIDFTGSPQELLATIRSSFLYQGQWNERQKKYRGHPSRKMPAPHFIHFLQNHDQIANSAHGLRTHALTSPGRHRALTTLLLLGPATPMLFMGQEFSASNPFHYFADHHPDLATLVQQGRAAFMSQFPRIHHIGAGCQLTDPGDVETFNRGKLNWEERERNVESMLLHRDLLRLRRSDPVFARQDKSQIEGAIIGSEAFVLRWYDDEGNDRLMLVNLGRDFDLHPVTEPLLAAPPERHWRQLWSSEAPCYGGIGTPAFTEKRWHIPGHAAVVLTVDPAAPPIVGMH